MAEDYHHLKFDEAHEVMKDLGSWFEDKKIDVYDAGGVCILLAAYVTGLLANDREDFESRLQIATNLLTTISEQGWLHKQASRAKH